MKKAGELAPDNTPPDLIAAREMVEPAESATDNTEITRGPDSSESSSKYSDNVADSFGDGYHGYGNRCDKNEDCNPSQGKNGLDSLYEEFDENDITEIYFGRSETENAVAGLEKCTAEEEAAHQMEEYEVNENVQEHNSNGYEQLVKRETDSSEYDCNHNGNVNNQRKRNASSDSDGVLTKRIKLERGTEQSPLESSSVRSVRIDTEREFQVTSSQTNVSSTYSNSAIDLCPPVAIVTPLSYKNDISSEADAIKYVNGTKVDVKTDINSIINSLENSTEQINKECSKEKNDIKEESLFLSDSDFEKFKNDLFSEQSFQTADGNNWTFQRTNCFAYQSADKSVNVEKNTLTFEAQVEDFEKIFDKLIQSDSDKYDTKSATNGRVVASTVHVTSTTSTTKFKSKPETVSPNVTLTQSDILRNSELLRELLEHDTDTSLKSQNNSKRPVSVDLSFLSSDTIYSNRSSASASAILKTKTIDPIPTGELLRTTSSTDASSKPDTVYLTDSLDNESTDTKAADHGPLSLAEQRRASVTLHHKVPNISDLVSSSGPLNRMNGDETEALLNELTSYPTSSQSVHHSRDFLSAGLQAARPEYTNGSSPITSPFAGFHSENVHTANALELRMKMSTGQMASGCMAGNRGVGGLTQHDLEAMPPERRHLLASRYGHMIRNDRPAGGFPDEMSNPLTRTSVNELLTDSRTPLNPVNTSMSMNSPPIQSYDQYQMNVMRGISGSNGLASDQIGQPTAEINSYGNANTKDRMRYLMMQQLHRRSMEAQMAARGQAPVGGQAGMIPQGPHPSEAQPPMHDMMSNASPRPRFPNQIGGLPPNAGHGPYYRPQMESQAHFSQHNDQMVPSMMHGPGANIYQRQLALQRQQQQQQQQQLHQQSQHPQQHMYHRTQLQQQHPQHQQQMLLRMNEHQQPLPIDRFSPGHHQQHHQFSSNHLKQHQHQQQSHQTSFSMQRIPGSASTASMPQMQGPFASMQSQHPHHHQPHHQQQVHNFLAHSQDQLQFNPLSPNGVPFGANAQQASQPTTPTLPAGMAIAGGEMTLKNEPSSTDSLSEYFF